MTASDEISEMKKKQGIFKARKKPKGIHYQQITLLKDAQGSSTSWIVRPIANVTGTNESMKPTRIADLQLHADLVHRNRCMRIMILVTRQDQEEKNNERNRIRKMTRNKRRQYLKEEEKIIIYLFIIRAQFSHR